MSPVTHLLAGWVIAGAWPQQGRFGPLTRREKAMIVAAGVAPDIDGLGAIPELLTRHSSHPLLWFSEYHHSLHTLAFAIVFAAAACVVSASANFSFGSVIGARPKPSHPTTTGVLAFFSFHLHLFCDLIGARGPDGDSWPIPYLKPFSNTIQLEWHGQWALNAWQNFVIAGALLLLTFWLAWKRGTSPLELVSDKWNRQMVMALRKRFGSKEKFTAAIGE